ncbi:Uncharacterised protein [Candidatus Tiddalikarchaeum anstoanum]|nr:Uncharacterised protein [Candidatus Tiddalikarchaeum anstoanum]
MVKAQVSLEYLFIFATILLAIIGLLSFSNSFLYQQRIDYSINSAVVQIHDIAKSVALMGYPARQTINVYIPKNIDPETTYVRNSTINFGVFEPDNALRDVFRLEDFCVKGNLPYYEGYYVIRALAVNDCVLIDYHDLYINPSRIEKSVCTGNIAAETLDIINLLDIPINVSIIAEGNITSVTDVDSTILGRQSSKDLGTLQSLDELYNIVSFFGDVEGDYTGSLTINNDSVEVLLHILSCQGAILSQTSVNATNVLLDDYVCINTTVTPGVCGVDQVWAELFKWPNYFNMTLYDTGSWCAGAAGDNVYGAQLQLTQLGTYTLLSGWVNDTCGNMNSDVANTNIQVSTGGAIPEGDILLSYPSAVTKNRLTTHSFLVWNNNSFAVNYIDNVKDVWSTSQASASSCTLISPIGATLTCACNAQNQCNATWSGQFTISPQNYTIFAYSFDNSGSDECLTATATFHVINSTTFSKTRNVCMLQNAPTAQIFLSLDNNSWSQGINYVTAGTRNTIYVQLKEESDKSSPPVELTNPKISLYLPKSWTNITSSTATIADIGLYWEINNSFTNIDHGQFKTFSFNATSPDVTGLSTLNSYIYAPNSVDPSNNHELGILTKEAATPPINITELDLWEILADRPLPVDFTSGLNTTGNTFGPNGANDGWDWSNNIYGTTSTCVFWNTGTVGVDHNLRIDIGDVNNGCSNSGQGDGAYGILFYINSSIASSSVINLSFAWTYTPTRLGTGESAWVKGRFGNTTTMNYLGANFGGTNDDATNDIYYSNTPTFQSGTFTQNVKQWVSNSGWYYLDFGCKVRTWSNNNWLTCTFDNVDVHWS